MLDKRRAEILVKKEAEIQEGKVRLANGWLIIASALCEIEEMKLFQDAGYSSLERYVMERHNLEYDHCLLTMRAFREIGSEIVGLPFVRVKQILRLPAHIKEEFRKTNKIKTPEGVYSVQQLATMPLGDFDKTIIILKEPGVVPVASAAEAGEGDAKEKSSAVSAAEKDKRPISSSPKVTSTSSPAPATSVSKTEPSSNKTVYQEAKKLEKEENRLSKQIKNNLERGSSIEKELYEHISGFKSSLKGILDILSGEFGKQLCGDINNALTDDVLRDNLKNLLERMPTSQLLEFGEFMVAKSLERIKEEVKEAKEDPSFNEYLRDYQGFFDNLSKNCVSFSDFTKRGKKKLKIVPDNRVKVLVDFYYGLWDNNPPEQSTGKSNAGGRIARVFQELLGAVKENDPVEHIKTLYLFYKNVQTPSVPKQYKWIFEDSVRSIVQFQGKYPHIKDSFVNGGSCAGEFELFGKTGSDKKDFGIPKHLKERAANF